MTDNLDQPNNQEEQEEEKVSDEETGPWVTG